MKILAHEEIKLEMSDILARVNPRVDSTNQPERAPGVHLSGVLKEWAVKSKVLEEREWDEGENELPLRMFMGLCVEWGVSRLYPETEWWPGTIVRDGVAGSPDGVSTLIDIDNLRGTSIGDEFTYIIEEIKYTHMSCSNGRDIPNLNDRQGVKDWWRRLQQVMGYCNLHPARPTLARFHVIYGVGDYVRPYKERYFRTLVEFGQAELDKNWEMIRKYKRTTKAERGNGQ